jgi:outer membrane protein assembly factor BamB
MSSDIRDPVSQAGTTSSLPVRAPARARGAAIGIAAVIVIAGILLGSFLVSRSSQRSLQSHGPVYYVTPQGGPPPTQTPQVNLGLRLLSPPTPVFFLDGHLYRNSSVYRVDTGAPVQHYLQNLGDVEIYQPRLVAGILYMAVREMTPEARGARFPMSMYAVRAGDGRVLWKWETCGDRVNMSAPVILNNTVYFICQLAPSQYRLYALRADTGKLVWFDALNGEVAFNLPVDRQTLYVQIENRLLAIDAATGRQLWQQSFGESGDFISQATLSRGVLYITQQTTFFALQAGSGKRLWEYHFLDGYGYISAVVNESSVYILAGERDGSEIVYALAGATGEMHWQKSLGNDSYGTPVVDGGNLYFVVNLLAGSNLFSPAPFTRAILALRASDGRTLWQQDIPWNKGTLNYSLLERPTLAVGDGRLYLVDWQVPTDSQNLPAVLGAFSESTGAVLWTENLGG